MKNVLSNYLKSFSISYNLFFSLLLLNMGAVFGQNDKVDLKRELECHLKFSATICGDIEFLVKPQTKVSSDFKVRFFDVTSKKLFPPLTSDLYLWMKMNNGHEHGSKPLKIQRHPTHLMVTDVHFVMAGRWQIVFKVEKDELAEKEEDKFDKFVYWIEAPKS